MAAEALKNNGHTVPASKSRKRGSRTRYKITMYVLLTIMAVIVLMPFFYLFSTAFKSLKEVASGEANFIPKTNALIENIKIVLNEPKFRFIRYFLNTMLIFVLKTAGVLLTCSLAAYGFARFDCRFARIMFMALLSILLLPGEILGIPFYEAMVNLKLVSSPLYIPIWLGAWFGIDITTIFLFRQFFITIPTSLTDAAKIDGCGEHSAFFRIILPQVKPVIMTTVILYFVGTYNDLYSPLLYIPVNERDRWVVAQGIGVFEGMFNFGSADYLIPYNYVAVATIISILPVLVFFFAAQRSFVESLIGSSVKG